LSVSEVKAVMLVGTSASDSSRLRALTTTVSMPALFSVAEACSWAAAGAAAPSMTASSAAPPAQTPLINGIDFIVELPCRIGRFDLKRS